jgi:hypothetical protein
MISDERHIARVSHGRSHNMSRHPNRNTIFGRGRHWNLAMRILRVRIWIVAGRFGCDCILSSRRCCGLIEIEHVVVLEDPIVLFFSIRIPIAQHRAFLTHIASDALLSRIVFVKGCLETVHRLCLLLRGSVRHLCGIEVESTPWLKIQALTTLAVPRIFRVISNIFSLSCCPICEHFATTNRIDLVVFLRPGTGITS